MTGQVQPLMRENALDFIARFGARTKVRRQRWSG